MSGARLTRAEFLEKANAILPRTQMDPHPVTSIITALARLRHHGTEGEALRRQALESGL